MDAVNLPIEVVVMPRPRTRQTRRPNKEDIALGARLKALRKERGVSQADLAEGLSVDQRTISCYELGQVRIPARELLKIAAILKASLKELTGDNSSATNAKSRELVKVLEKVECLPPRKQRQVTEYIELLAKAGGA